ncbi:MAG TPA: hypothetical protein VMY16_16085 [Ilumatobacteraceae bacterium]|nr:hypothetical protein [Ilumatobacteraceae bacterium]
MCTDGDCSGLYMAFFVAVVGAVVLVGLVWTLWAMALSAALERLGWSPAKRRTTAGVSTAGIGLLLLAVAFGAMDVSAFLAVALVVGAAPAAIWQRRLTKRSRGDDRGAERGGPHETHLTEEGTT